MATRCGEVDLSPRPATEELDAKWGSRWSQLDTKLEQRLAELGSSLRVEIHAARADVVKWMFVFWAPTAIAVIDLLLRH